ncbi:MAG: protein kinase domain-containing protein [Planctomycetaceae bacterium]
MADDVRAAARGPNPLPGFSLQPMDGTDTPWWFQGVHDASGVRVLARRFEGLAFADVLRDLSTAVESLDAPQSQAGVAAPLAIAVTCRGAVAAGSAAAASGLTISAAAEVAGAIAADAPVDAWAIYAARGDEALAPLVTDPRAACGRLAKVAEVLDQLPEGHGAVDSRALRITAEGPLVLAAGFAPLESARRGRLDAVGPWLTVSPERCLPPGLPSAAGDQYALAALWVLGRTGGPPHPGMNAEAVVRSKLTDAPRLEGLGDAERNVLARALAGAAEGRFESSTAFATALLATLPGGHTDDLAAQPAVDQPAVADDPAAPEATPRSSAPPPRSAAADTTRGSLDATAPLPAVSPPTAVETPVVAPQPIHANEASDGAGDRPRAAGQEQVVIPADTRPTLADTRSTPGGPQPTDHPAARLAVGPYKAGDLILPGYRLERLLGKGGFGEVWKASAPGGMSVAIKVIGNLGRKEGAREFRALRTVKDVHHAHIVPIFGVWLKTSTGRLLEEDEASRASERILSAQDRSVHDGTDDGGAGRLESLDLVVAMGLGDQTLHDRLAATAAEGREDGGLRGIDPGHLLGWMRQAALAIDFFNRGGMRHGTTSECVQHCDIKPQNMLLVGDAVQVCDFGLARVQGQARATANNLLSVAYAAPEMMVRPYNPSPSTDQYSLAVSYYELRTGRLPYGEPTAGGDEMSAVELMRAKTEGAVTVSLVPPTEQRVIRRALALEPAERFGSCAEFVDTLEAAIDADESPPVAPARRPFPWVQSLGVVAGAVVAAMLIAWLVPRRSTEVPQTRHLEEAQTALLRSATAEGLDLAVISQAADLAREARDAGEDADACREMLAVTDAVLQAGRCLDAADGDGRDLGPLHAARQAISDLPDVVPETLRGALRRGLVEREDGVRTRLQAEAAERLEAAIRPDGSVDDQVVGEAAALATSVAQLNDEAGQRLHLAINVLRSVSRVVTDGHPEPAGLDEAVRELDRAGDALPTPVAQALTRRAAERIIDRAKRRLLDNDLASPDAPTSGKKRAIEDSLQDIDAALKLDPRSWRATCERGFCESLRGRNAEAIDAYTTALLLLAEAGDTPADRNRILQRRAFALKQAGRYAAAADDYLVFMAGDQKLPARLWDLKSIALEKEAYAEAAAILERLDGWLAGHPSDSTGAVPATEDVIGELAWLVACGFGTDPVGRAVPLAERLRTRDVSTKVGDASDDLRRANALDTLAAAYARAGRFDDAVEAVEESIGLLTAILDRVGGNRDVEDQRRQAQRHRDAFAKGLTWDEP